MYYGRVQHKLRVTRKIMMTREQELRSAVTVDYLLEKRSCDRSRSTVHCRGLNSSRYPIRFLEVTEPIDCHSRVAAPNRRDRNRDPEE